jgi:hypothetical protein
MAKINMCRFHKLFHGIAAVGLVIGAAGTAQATCVAEGKISRLRAGAAGDCVDVQTLGNLPNFATFSCIAVGTENTDRFYSILSSAQAANETVFVTGDAVSCPTSGQFRFGGNVLGVDIFRNQ